MSQKARNLVALFRSGIAVPMGFSLDGSHYSDAIAPIERHIAKALPNAALISEMFASIHIPARTVAAIEAGLESLAGASTYAVRSSGGVVTQGRCLEEDGAITSLAGQFESYLHVPRDRVLDAVRACWASLFNQRSIVSFEADAAYVHESSMSVVIQEMLPAVASAVIMTVDPLGDGHVGGIEIALGPCEAIVSGIVSPDEVYFSRTGGAILHTTIGKKEFRIEYEAFRSASENGRRVPVANEDRMLFSVSPTVIAALISIGHQIEGIFARPQDIEIIITSAGQIVVTQTRAITRVPTGTVPFHLAIAA